MKEPVESLLIKRDFVNLERRTDNLKVFSITPAWEFFGDLKDRIPQEELDKHFFLFVCEKGHNNFFKAYDTISEILDDGWDRSDLN